MEQESGLGFSICPACFVTVAEELRAANSDTVPEKPKRLLVPRRARRFLLTHREPPFAAMTTETGETGAGF